LALEPIRLTEEQVQGLVWEPWEVTEDYIRSRAIYGLQPNGEPCYAYKTEILEGSKFLESVQQERNDNEGRRWSEGMGSDKNGNMPLVKVASLPLNLYYRDFDGRFSDRDFTKWYFDQERNQPFRVRKGDF
jgi:hypothetical protein